MAIELIPTSDSTAILPVEKKTPVTVIGTEAIRSTFDEVCLQQAINSRNAPVLHTWSLIQTDTVAMVRRLDVYLHLLRISIQGRLVSTSSVR